MVKRILLLGAALIAVAGQTSLIAQALHVGAALSNYNGVNISCAHLSDGSITLSVTGGTAPYTYLWNTGATTQNLSGLTSGTYSVVVKDAVNTTVNKSYLLKEPAPIDISATPYEYPTGFNVSCFSCYNGSIAVTVGGGRLPYTYSWNDGATTEDRSSLGMGNYQLTVTDVNGCTGTGSSVYIDEPERADWTMFGNTGSNPPTQFIGTNDNKALVFKTNGEERLRLLADGTVKIPSVATTAGYSLLVSDSLGNVLKLDVGIASKPCPSQFPWLLCGNPGTVPGTQFLGTTDYKDLVFKTNAITRVRISADGKVGIGVPPADLPASSEYNLFVEGGISTRDVLVKLGTWPDFVFDKSYHLMPLEQLKAYLSAYHHLPGIPSAAEVKTRGGVEVGDLQTRMLKVAEEQALYILELKNEVDALKARLAVLESKQ